MEKIADGVEAHWLSGKGKDPSSAVNRESQADRLLGHETTHYY